MSEELSDAQKEERFTQWDRYREEGERIRKENKRLKEINETQRETIRKLELKMRERTKKVEESELKRLYDENLRLHRKGDAQEILDLKHTVKELEEKLLKSLDNINYFIEENRVLKEKN
jgi:hypothetical protein